MTEHYRCPDCGEPCSCDPESPARRMAHRPCGIRPGTRLGPIERRPRSAADLTLERRQRLAAAAELEEQSKHPAPRATFTVSSPADRERWAALVAARTGARR
jgi:hypothetical protein